MKNKITLLNVISWIFGMIFFGIGVINIFWGNDQGFGIFVILLSSVYFPPVTNLFREKSGIQVPWVIIILIGIFIFWAALGVGELPDKIDLMLMSLNAG